MKLNELLEKEKMINRSELARVMFPGIENAPVRLVQKLRGLKAGSGKQRITESDEAKAKEVLLALSKRLAEWAESE